MVIFGPNDILKNAVSFLKQAPPANMHTSFHSVVKELRALPTPGTLSFVQELQKQVADEHQPIQTSLQYRLLVARADHAQISVRHTLYALNIPGYKAPETERNGAARLRPWLELVPRSLHGQITLSAYDRDVFDSITRDVFRYMKRAPSASSRERNQALTYALEPDVDALFADIEETGSLGLLLCDGNGRLLASTAAADGTAKWGLGSNENKPEDSEDESPEAKRERKKAEKNRRKKKNNKANRKKREQAERAAQEEGGAHASIEPASFREPSGDITLSRKQPLTQAQEGFEGTLETLEEVMVDCDDLADRPATKVIELSKNGASPASKEDTFMAEPTTEATAAEPQGGGNAALVNKAEAETSSPNEEIGTVEESKVIVTVTYHQEPPSDDENARAGDAADHSIVSSRNPAPASVEPSCGHEENEEAIINDGSTIDSGDEDGDTPSTVSEEDEDAAWETWRREQVTAILGAAGSTAAIVASASRSSEEVVQKPAAKKARFWSSVPVKLPPITPALPDFQLMQQHIWKTQDLPSPGPQSTVGVAREESLAPAEETPAQMEEEAQEEETFASVEDQMVFSYRTGLYSERLERFWVIKDTPAATQKLVRNNWKESRTDFAEATLERYRRPRSVSLPRSWRAPASHILPPAALQPEASGAPSLRSVSEAEFLAFWMVLGGLVFTLGQQQEDVYRRRG